MKLRLFFVKFSGLAPGWGHKCPQPGDRFLPLRPHWSPLAYWNRDIDNLNDCDDQAHLFAFLVFLLSCPICLFLFHLSLILSFCPLLFYLFSHFAFLFWFNPGNPKFSWHSQFTSLFVIAFTLATRYGAVCFDFCSILAILNFLCPWLPLPWPPGTRGWTAGGCWSRLAGWKSLRWDEERDKITNTLTANIHDIYPVDLCSAWS